MQEYSEAHFDIQHSNAPVVGLSGGTEVKGSQMKRFKIDKTSLAPAINPHTLDIAIESTKEFGSTKEIRAIYIKKNKNTGESVEQLAGKLRVMPNNEEHRKVKNIVLVNVMTDIMNTSRDVEEGFKSIKPDVTKKNLQKYLRQALIDPVITETEIKLQTPGSTKATFNQKFQWGGFGIVGYTEGTSADDIDSFLMNQLKPADIKPNAIYIFCFGLPLHYRTGPTDGKGLNGYSVGNRVVLGYDSDLETPVHETLHSMGLPHTFENSKQKKVAHYENALYTYKEKTTGNLLDYSKTENSRHFLFNWQSAIVRNNCDNEPLYKHGEVSNTKTL